MKTRVKFLLLVVFIFVVSPLFAQNLDVSYLHEPYLETAIAFPNAESRDVSTYIISRREGSFSGDVIDQARDVRGRLQTVLKSIRQMIPTTIKSVEADILQLNRDRSIIAIACFAAGVFNMLGGAFPFNNINEVSSGGKIQVLAQFLYSYGYSRPWQDVYEPPKLDCGRKEFEEALQDFDFLENPDPETDANILIYYTTELNHNIKRKLYCLSSRRGTSQEAKDLFALVDLYTELQEEILEADSAEDSGELENRRYYQHRKRKRRQKRIL